MKPRAKRAKAVMAWAILTARGRFRGRWCFTGNDWDVAEAQTFKKRGGRICEGDKWIKVRIVPVAPTRRKK